MGIQSGSELARGDKKTRFLSIAHLLTVGALVGAFYRLRKEASAGIDGVTYAAYEANVQENVERLHDRLKSGKYRAEPLRRVYIPKEDGKQRANSIPALEDKIVQKATVELLNAIYEEDFLVCSYGFRRMRGAQDPLDEIGGLICRRHISYVLEADICNYFDAIVRSLLMEMVGRRIGDGSILRLIGKWLNTSQNWYAEMLLKQLGRQFGQAGSWREGLAVERLFLIDSVGVDSTQFALSDGSGLSTTNLVSPQAFVKLLAFMEAPTVPDLGRGTATRR